MSSSLRARMRKARRRRTLLRRLGGSLLEVVEDVSTALSPDGPGGSTVTDAEAAQILRGVAEEMVESIWATLYQLGQVESRTMPQPPPPPSASPLAAVS